MTSNADAPTFEEFVKWLVQKGRPDGYAQSPGVGTIEAARAARDEYLRISAESQGQWSGRVAPRSFVETIHCLAAADSFAGKLPPELATARGFRISLHYDEGPGAGQSSICVLVHCPPHQIDRVFGKTVSLRSGSELFELGQFDADGKAVGLLPAGIELTLADFEQGLVQIEGPDIVAEE